LGNQWHRLWRLEQIGVDVAISDSPLGIGIPYIRRDKLNYADKYIDLVKALYNQYLSANIMVERDIYASGGYKGNSKKNRSGYVLDLDRQIREVATPPFTVTYGLDAGQKVFEYVKPMVVSYMETKR
jgi:hypothetical protein